jgi:spore coat protein JB
MSEREALLKRISILNFSIDDLGLYLDSHPNDKTAIKLYNDFVPKYKALVAEYESKYGPLSTDTVDKNNMWAWIKDPWPWDYEGES